MENEKELEMKQDDRDAGVLVTVRGSRGKKEYLLIDRDETFEGELKNFIDYYVERYKPADSEDNTLLSKCKITALINDFYDRLIARFGRDRVNSVLNMGPLFSEEDKTMLNVITTLTGDLKKLSDNLSKSPSPIDPPVASGKLETFQMSDKAVKKLGKKLEKMTKKALRKIDPKSLDTLYELAINAGIITCKTVSKDVKSKLTEIEKDVVKNEKPSDQMDHSQPSDDSLRDTSEEPSCKE